MKDNQTFPLSMGHKGDILKLVKVNAGSRLNHRLADLGLTPGVKIEIMQDSGGPLLLSVRSSRVALGRGMAGKILVKNSDEPSGSYNGKGRWGKHRRKGRKHLR